MKERIWVVGAGYSGVDIALVLTRSVQKPSSATK